MGGLISTVKDNKVSEIKFHTFDEKIKKKSESAVKKYKDLLNSNGFYTVQIDLSELSKYIESKIEKRTIEKFVNQNKVEGFIDVNYKTSISDENKSLGLMIIVGSLMGWYTVAFKSLSVKQASVSDMKILISKMYLDKKKYVEWINFIFDEYLNSFQSKNEIEKNKKTKKLILYMLEKINNKKNPEIFFGNIISLLIKTSIVMGANKFLKKKKISDDVAIAITFDEISSLIPDDTCITKPDSVKFLKISPSLCKESDKSGSTSQSGSKIWLFTTILFFILSIVMVYLYLNKQVKQVK
jgi:hypothetical protein